MMMGQSSYVVGGAAVLLASVWCYRCLLGKKKKGDDEESKTFPSEVIFFPDEDLDCAATKEENVSNYKGILQSSRPQQRLISHLREARESVDLCLYLITSERLAEAVLSLIPKGVRVRLILDDGSVALQGSQAGRFRQRGAFVRSRKMNYLMHHKFAIVDGRKLVSGSFNWTMQAVMGNKENVIVTKVPEIVAPFVEEFERLWQQLG